MKKILVPIDFSPLSLAALNYAANLSEFSKARIYILHVIHTPYVYIADTDSLTYSYTFIEEHKLMEEHKQNASASLDALKYSKKYSGLNIIPKILVVNNIYKGILDFAEKEKIDLIVMGSNGPFSLKERIIGTTAERILRFTAIPVLIIRNSGRIFKVKNIVYPVKSEADAVKVYPLINTIADMFGAKIHLLRINTKREFETTDAIKNGFDRIKKRLKGNIKTAIRAANEVDEGIVMYAKEARADLIAIGVRRRKGPSRYFTDRITEEVIRESVIPVLAIDNPR